MKQVGENVHVGARVAEIRLQERGVEVIVERNGGKERMTADFCLNSIPMQLLTGLTHNFPADYATGLAAIPRGKYFKLAFQAKERFWERENIYGGISWTTQDISQIWYPSQGIHKRKGVILGAYTFAAEAGDKWARLTPQQRLEVALKQGAKVHPRYREYIENGVSVCWHRMNHMLGCAAAWSESLRAQWFRKLQAPAGHHYLIGDQISDHPSWQEGALHATFHVLEDIDRRVREQAGAAA
jgi:monoamine oxidase